MEGHKVKEFMEISGILQGEEDLVKSSSNRELGARLLLSEVLEYVIKGLGVVPSINGQEITDPESIQYNARNGVDRENMIDGLADVAYTMFWNAIAFGVPVEEAFEIVCDNNLTKFVLLEEDFCREIDGDQKTLPKDMWHCGKEVAWPPSVVDVRVVCIGDKCYAVGVDKGGKVQKPSSYSPPKLRSLCAR